MDAAARQSDTLAFTIIRAGGLLDQPGGRRQLLVGKARVAGAAAAAAAAAALAPPLADVPHRDGRTHSVAVRLGVSVRAQWGRAGARGRRGAGVHRIGAGWSHGSASDLRFGALFASKGVQCQGDALSGAVRVAG